MADSKRPEHKSNVLGGWLIIAAVFVIAGILKYFLN